MWGNLVAEKRGRKKRRTEKVVAGKLGSGKEVRLLLVNPVVNFRIAAVYLFTILRAISAKGRAAAVDMPFRKSGSPRCERVATFTAAEIIGIDAYWSIPRLVF